MIGKTGESEQIDAHESGESFQFVFDPDFTVIEVFSRDRVIA